MMVDGSELSYWRGTGAARDTLLPSLHRIPARLIQ